MFHLFLERKAKKYLIVLSLMIVCTLLLGACSNQQPPKSKPSVKKEKPIGSVLSAGEKWKLPISIPEGEFYKIGGWYAENQLLYITNKEQTSNVYCYDLLSGVSKLLYKSDYPIVDVQMSPSKKYLLIHSSPSTYEGLISILDSSGLEIFKQSLASFELEFSWNPYDESKIMVSKFNEDWTFQILLINLKDAKTTEISLPQPFIKWVGIKDIAFIDWDNNNPTLNAPLIIKKLGNEKEKTVFPEVFQFSTFQNVLMTITVNDQDQSKANYSFFDKEIKPIFNFSIPQLSKFSDWLVPFYDYNVSKSQFITFRPLRSGESDSYTEGFELVSYDLIKGRNTLILDRLENEPLTLSPTGEACLYGNLFEKIIDLHAKKIYTLVKE